MNNCVLITYQSSHVDCNAKYLRMTSVSCSGYIILIYYLPFCSISSLLNVIFEKSKHSRKIKHSSGSSFYFLVVQYRSIFRSQLISHTIIQYTSYQIYVLLLFSASNYNKATPTGYMNYLQRRG